MNNKKINILFLIDTYKDGGGTETHLAYLVKYLDKNKFNLIICAFDLEECPFVQKIRDDGVIVKHIPVGRFYGIKAIIQAFKLLKLIKDYDIDIVQTYHFKSDTYGVLVAKLSSQVKILSSRRDIGDLKKPRHILLNRLINPFIDKFIMVCDAVGKACSKNERIPQRKMVTIYNGVDTGRIKPELNDNIHRWKNEAGIDKDIFVIGSLAYFRPEKAYHVFFQGVEKIRSEIKNFHVLILGDGPLRNQFEAYCKERKLTNNVTFLGSIVDVPKYIALMDVICLVPTGNEGFSNAILEGMAMGKPIIASNIGGNVESIVDGETGIIIPPNDSESLSKAILKLYHDPYLRNKMGEMGRKRTEECFTVEKMIKRMERLYVQISMSNKKNRP